MAANVSKDTTVKELVSIDGIDKEVFRLQNINLFFGNVNSVEYATTMYNLPTLVELEEMIG